MKKFKGFVNGRSFDNIKDFNKAAAQAMLENDGVLSISSYFTYDDCGCGTCDNDCAKKEIDNNLKLNDYAYNSLSEVSDSLKTRLQNATNKDEIHSTVTSIVNKIDETISSSEETISALKNKLRELEDNVKEQTARKKYYNQILGIIKVSKAVEKFKDTKNDFIKYLNEFKFWDK